MSVFFSNTFLGYMSQSKSGSYIPEMYAPLAGQEYVDSILSKGVRPLLLPQNSVCTENFSN